MDVYAQALTPAKRAAQLKVAQSIRPLFHSAPTEKPDQAATRWKDGRPVRTRTADLYRVKVRKNGTSTSYEVLSVAFGSV